jgi:hypothetical protein
MIPGKFPASNKDWNPVDFCVQEVEVFYNTKNFKLWVKKLEKLVDQFFFGDFHVICNFF